MRPADIVRMARDWSRGGEPIVREPNGRAVDVVAFPLERVSKDLAGTTALLRIVDGALVADALEPERDPAFRAVPNHVIEQALRDAIRTFRALSESPDGFVDAEGRTLNSRGTILYPSNMPEIGSTRPSRETRERNRALALGSVALVALFLSLIAIGAADPIVCVAMPAPLLYAFALLRANRDARDLDEVSRTWTDRLGRARVQARSITTAANRARGLGA